MIVEVMFDNRIVCAQEFPDISTRDYYIPDINIDTKCRHSFDALELVLNTLSEQRDLHLIRIIIQ